MGASASVNTIVSSVTNRVENTLIQQAEASASATCRVTIGSIIFRSTQGCTISVRNLCSANAIAQVDAVIDATIEFYNDLTFEQKQEAPTWFTSAFNVSTTVSTIENDFRQLVEQRCKAEAIVDSEITITNIEIDNCVAPASEGIVRFEFLNTGEATGQCAIGMITDLLVTGSNKVAASQSQGLDWSTIIWPITIIGIFIVIAVLLYYMRGLITKPSDKIKLELVKRSPGVETFARFKELIKKE